MKIIPLSEGKFTIDQTKVFVPFDETKDDLKARPSGSLLVEIQPFVVITSKDVLLLDTGLGFNNPDGVLQIKANLKNAGIDPDSVTKVLLSHLHKDHAGAACTSDRGLNFPNAVYYVQEKELDYAYEKGFPSYFTEDLDGLKNASNVVLLTEDEGVIDNYIHYKITGAHSKFHQVFWIKDESETAFFGADDAPQLQQMKHKFAAKYDYDGKKAMELRLTWKDQGTKENWTFLFYHDISSGMYQFP
jgi:glyoxylase-like metal-dependent hydrolase (beta-lactamase superfamily II)